MGASGAECRFWRPVAVYESSFCVWVVGGGVWFGGKREGGNERRERMREDGETYVVEFIPIPRPVFVDDARAVPFVPVFLPHSQLGPLPSPSPSPIHPSSPSSFPLPKPPPPLSSGPSKQPNPHNSPKITPLRTPIKPLLHPDIQLKHPPPHPKQPLHVAQYLFAHLHTPQVEVEESELFRRVEELGRFRRVVGEEFGEGEPHERRGG